MTRMPRLVVNFNAPALQWLVHVFYLILSNIK